MKWDQFVAPVCLFSIFAYIFGVLQLSVCFAVIQAQVSILLLPKLLQNYCLFIFVTFLTWYISEWWISWNSQFDWNVIRISNQQSGYFCHVLCTLVSSFEGINFFASCTHIGNTDLAKNPLEDVLHFTLILETFSYLGQPGTESPFPQRKCASDNSTSGLHQRQSPLQ